MNEVSRKLSQVATGGALWLSLSISIAKVSSILGQLVLGFILDVATFGIIAIAIVAIQLAAVLQYDGIGKLAVQRPHVPPFLYKRVAIIIGTTSGILVALLGLLFSILYEESELIWFIALIAIANPVISLLSLYSSQAALLGRFVDISVADSAYSLVYTFALIMLAIAGVGALSMAIAFLLGWAAKYAFYRIRYGNLQKRQEDVSRQAIDIKPLIWILPAGFLFALAQQLDYLVLAGILSNEEVGYYYFGFMLTASLGRLISQGAASTLLPLFSLIGNDLDRLSRAAERTNRVISFAAGILSLCILVTVGPLVEVLWGQKWQPAVAIATVMAVSLPYTLLITASTAVLESQAKWKWRFILQVFDVASVGCAAGAGALLAGLEGAAYAVGSQRILTGLLYFFLGTCALNWPLTRSLSGAAQAVLPFTAVALAFLLWPLGNVPAAGSILSLAVAVGLAVATCLVFVAVTYVFARPALLETFNLAWPRLSKLRFVRRKG